MELIKEKEKMVPAKKMHSILVSFLQEDVKKNREKWLRIDYCNHLLVVITELWGMYVDVNVEEKGQKDVNMAKSYVKRAHLVAVIDDVLHPGKRTKCQKNRDSLKRFMKPDWKELYRDDEYDPATGEFTSLSPDSQKEYEEDRKRFSFIEGRAEGGGSREDMSHIEQYADNLTKMWFDRSQRQQSLRQMTQDIFDEHVSDEEIMKRIVETRQQIIDMFTACEEYYARGLDLYDAIVESLILKTTQRQIHYLENLRSVR